ncbi:MAG: diaminopimelate epimerase [Phycisphaerales bacterium JB050]
MSQKIPFVKVNGCGNDFVLIDRSRLIPSQVERMDREFDAGLAEWLCDRRRGIGADGVLLLDSADHGWSAQIVNADGSDGGMCGNGLRCIALYLLNRGDASAREPIPIAMGGRVTELRIEREEPFHASLNLGTVQLDHISGTRPVQQKDLEALNAMFVGSVSGIAWVGNPHAAILLRDLPGPGEGSVPQAIRNSGLFPDGVNVTMAVLVDRGHLRAMTDERGVGPTQACASGAAALVAIMHQAGIVDATCEVEMPGGSLSIGLSQDPQNPKNYLARIRGGAEFAFQGEIPISAPKSTA